MALQAYVTRRQKPDMRKWIVATLLPTFFVAGVAFSADGQTAGSQQAPDNVVAVDGPRPNNADDKAAAEKNPSRARWKARSTP